MLTQVEITELSIIANKSLDRAEELWNNTIGIKKFALKESETAEANIPGHPYLKENDYVSDFFIAMMIDMRDATKHLRIAISHKRAQVSQMQRVYYEVSSLLPTLAKVIQNENGAVTEYLGDGALALFQIPRERSNEQNNVMYAASRAARKCVQALHKVVNPVLDARYCLPPIQIGVGMAISDAIITRFGHRPDTQIKVIGECIYFASHLSKGHDDIIVHEWLKNAWPTGPNPKLKFHKPYSKDDVKGFLMEEI